MVGRNNNNNNNNSNNNYNNLCRNDLLEQSRKYNNELSCHTRALEDKIVELQDRLEDDEVVVVKESDKDKDVKESES